MAIKVQNRSAEVEAMAAAWPIADALLGGTAAMRAAGKAFLPKWPGEEKESYDARLGTATLFPAFARTLGVMAGKPFSKQITLGDDVPARIKAWCDDVDLQGNNLHTFAASVMDEVLGYGLAGVLVDHPKVAGARTLADERAIGARPYMVAIKHSQILGWKAERRNGATVLTQLRLAETKEVDDGDFGTKHEPRVRVLTPGGWAVYMPGARAEDEWVLEDQGTTTLKAIPFAPVYGRKRGFMNGVSPLLDLAYLNVKHWQSQSDQDTVMHVARVPILAMIGADDDSKLTVGASTAIKLPMGAEMKFVEHTGAAIEAGAKSLEALEDQMIQTGAELLVQKPGQRSATEASNDAEANKSDLQRITEAFEDSLDQALHYFAAWIGQPQGGHVSLFKDFASGSLSDASAQLIVTMQQGGLISKETAIREQQRRGILSPDLVAEEELATVDEAGPQLGDMTEMGNSAESVNQTQEASPPFDLTPVIAAIASLGDKIKQPDVMDFAPLIDAINAREAVTLEASIDTAPIAQAMKEAAQVAPVAQEVDLAPLQAQMTALQGQIAAIAKPEPPVDMERFQASILRDVQAAIAAIPAPQQAPILMMDQSGAITKQISIQRDQAGNITGASVKQ